ncbi:2-oxoglutarate and iron-dependent oxygenase domain-containing protein [Nonomuraea sp. NPDC059007]|uniref:2-oxoglutarate and iron-dependent oxygenase domain-containing protein n=1 Tax=Nonomuraea sp. NPDC059007 TaxID=3346692 RepID=UPI0036A22682
MIELSTFSLPEAITGTRADLELGRTMIAAWRRDGIFQVAATAPQHETALAAFEASREFFSLSLPEKSSYVSDLSYSGYVASGEEVTAGETDYSEIFTVCPDVPVHDARVRERWPCHGPVPWPGPHYQRRMETFTAALGSIGERLLRLAALGLGLGGPDTLTAHTTGGWHHMRVLRFPPRSARTARGIGAHTDYGLLVIAAQDEVGGLYIRPPVEGEKRPRNWLEAESTAGLYEDEPPWIFVRPVPRVFTVFPGDILQFLTGGYLLSTPHKVALADRERFAMAYFHEPSFGRSLDDPCGGPPLHYGTHFTNMFMRCYPGRAATRRIHEEGRLARLREPYPS